MNVRGSCQGTTIIDGCLLLLGRWPTGTVNSLLDLTSQTILGSVELLPDGSTLL